MPDFATEAELVAAFCAGVRRAQGPQRWTIYAETGGFDLLLVENETGMQVGLEAKLRFNLLVLTQALPSYSWQEDGPDYRGIIVPRREVQHYLPDIARRLGIGVVHVEGTKHEHFDLPDEKHDWSDGGWYPWLPTQRCVLPGYVPDVEGGKPAPVKLTDWKIRAIKLLILLERRGSVTRSDMKALRISPTAWTQPGGYLVPDHGRYVRCSRTPDFRSQHPTNWQQIEADFAAWATAPSGTQALMEMPAPAH